MSSLMVLFPIIGCELTQMTELINKENFIDAKVNRLPMVHRATTIAIDRQGGNMAVLQVHPNARSE